MQIIAVEKMDRGLAYGESCFETFRIIDGHIFDWPGHWQRLTAGLAEFGVLFAADDEAELRASCLKASIKLAADCLVRLTVSGGQASWGLLNRAEGSQVFIQCLPYQRGASDVTLRLARWPFPIKKKIAKFSADYAETLRALHGVTDANVLFEQSDALLATATANVLIYRQGCWFTPPATQGVLPGRVRACLLRSGLVSETRCPLDWLRDCEAMVLTNCAVFIQPVSHITAVQRSLNRIVPMQVEHVAIQLLSDALSGEEGVCL